MHHHLISAEDVADLVSGATPTPPLKKKVKSGVHLFLLQQGKSRSLLIRAEGSMLPPKTKVLKEPEWDWESRKVTSGSQSHFFTLTRTYLQGEGLRGALSPAPPPFSQSMSNELDTLPDVVFVRGLTEDEQRRAGWAALRSSSPNRPPYLSTLHGILKLENPSGLWLRLAEEEGWDCYLPAASSPRDLIPVGTEHDLVLALLGEPSKGRARWWSPDLVLAPEGALFQEEEHHNDPAKWAPLAGSWTKEGMLEGAEQYAKGAAFPEDNKPEVRLQWGRPAEPALPELLELESDEPLRQYLSLAGSEELELLEVARHAGRLFLRPKSAANRGMLEAWQGKAWACCRGHEKLMLPANVTITPPVRRDQYATLFGVSNQRGELVLAGGPDGVVLKLPPEAWRPLSECVQHTTTWDLHPTSRVKSDLFDLSSIFEGVLSKGRAVEADEDEDEEGGAGIVFA